LANGQDPKWNSPLDRFAVHEQPHQKLPLFP